MLEALSILLACQLLGEAAAYLFKLPVPGPVIGMAALFFLWPRLGPLQERVAATSTALLSHLGLLFVPAGVGVMLHTSLIAAWWSPLLLALVASTAATLALVAWVFNRLRAGRGAAL